MSDNQKMPADYLVLENEYLQEYHAPRVQTLADCPTDYKRPNQTLLWGFM